MDKPTIRPQDRFRKRIIDQERCSLYFLAGAGLIKIGVTTNLTSRIRAIRNSSPVALELLATMPRTTNFYEMKLHDKFAALRRHGEWFEDEGTIRAHIDELVRWGQAEIPCLRARLRPLQSVTR